MNSGIYKKYLFSLIIFFGVLGLVKSSWAAPAVNSSSGSFVHGQSITISGSAFGTKSPAAPLMWDDMEDRTVDSDTASTFFGYAEHSPSTESALASPYPTYARLRYRNVPYRSTTAAHSHSTKYLAGAHYQYADNAPPYIGTGAEYFRDVKVTVDAGSIKPRWFVIWYYRLDPLWRSDCPPYNNHKMSIVQSSGVGYYPSGEFSYESYRSQSPECVSSPQLGNFNCPDDCLGTWPTGFPQTNNPRTQWIHWEERIANDATLGFKDTYVDNSLGKVFIKNCPNWLPTGIRSYSIGGYYRWGTNINDVSTFRGDVNNFRYFDDIYVDSTLSRVMLANNQNYSQATIVEPQIPSAWSDGSITAKVNLGKLPDSGTAYLFVFDSNNEYNSVGYPVTLGSSSGDTTPPAAPTGVAVI